MIVFYALAIFQPKNENRTFLIDCCRSAFCFVCECIKTYLVDFYYFRFPKQILITVLTKKKIGYDNGKSFFWRPRHYDKIIINRYITVSKLIVINFKFINSNVFTKHTRIKLLKCVQIFGQFAQGRL